MLPKISVVLPVWNGEKYLREAIDSILAQTFSDFELVVVNDGSVDDTRKILDSYSDGRVKVFHLEHGGIVAALNFGIAQARADWIARQDVDDVSRPKRLAKQWEATQWRPKAILSYTDIVIVNEMAGAVERSRFPRTRAMLALRLCVQSPLTHSTVMFRKAAFLAAGSYRPEERHAEDYALWGRMLELGDFAGVPERLVNFRVHANSISKQQAVVQEELARRVAMENCRRFLGLNAEEATRAAGILRTPTRERAWADWSWFLTRCAPRLRWKSAETYGWMGWQTSKLLART